MATAAMHTEPRVREHLRLPVAVGLAVAGFFVGPAVLSIGGLGPAKFTDTGEFRLWLFLIATQTALWTLGAAALVDMLRTSVLSRIGREARSPVALWVGAAAVPIVGFVVASSLRSTLKYPLPHHSSKVTALSLAGATVALLGVRALARVEFALRTRPLAATKADYEWYLELRAVLQRVLAVEGAILGAAILATGALRNAVVVWHHNHGSAFPREFVLMYGGFFTLLLALLYAPVYQTLADTGRRLVDGACPAAEPKSAAWSDVYEKRKQLEELLQLQVTTSSSFRAGIAIMAPLASSVVGLLLGQA